ncbi:hypothetical protein WSK_2311 [Novosphingobium sp. Rr 2-17]|uniref:nuclear transport factor 2 family protein n=1 Tax=Novosphingobium sp. Rr 2-17 TaxID=555793 RepID=UPI0002699ECC|nr:nuclear transport factor 2 family protein [Novosphingobium sp. Rr 2-17]EIZ79124.1 hypothetical protein WSK_2311 [Novosphingobium sp. Rr 2-17]
MSAAWGKVGRRAVIGGLAAVATAPAVAGAKAKAPTPGQSPEELGAIAVIKAWSDALVAKDLPKALSFVDDAIQYRDDPFQIELKTGKAHLEEDLKILLRGLTAVTYQDVYVVGSPKNDVLVLTRRTDTFKLGDKSIDQAIGGYFRVRSGKILEWLDTPLVEMPKPPAGMPPLGGAPGAGGPPPPGAGPGH